MKKLLSKIKSGLSWLGRNIQKPFIKLANSKAVQGFLNSKFHKKWVELWDKSAFWMQIPLAMIIIFLMEWYSSIHLKSLVLQ